MKKSVPSRPVPPSSVLAVRIARSVQSIRQGFTMSKQMTPLKRRDFRSGSWADLTPSHLSVRYSPESGHASGRG